MKNLKIEDVRVPYNTLFKHADSIFHVPNRETEVRRTVLTTATVQVLSGVTLTEHIIGVVIGEPNSDPDSGFTVITADSIVKTPTSQRLWRGTYGNITLAKSRLEECMVGLVGLANLITGDGATPHNIPAEPMKPLAQLGMKASEVYSPFGTEVHEGIPRYYQVYRSSVKNWGELKAAIGSRITCHVTGDYLYWYDAGSTPQFLNTPALLMKYENLVRRVREVARKKKIRELENSIQGRRIDLNMLETKLSALKG